MPFLYLVLYYAQQGEGEKRALSEIQPRYQ